MSYDKPKVSQSFDLVVIPTDRDKDGKLTKNTTDFLAKVMPDMVHHIAPHVPRGRDIRIHVEIEGDLV